MSISKETYLKMYEDMILIRAFEEKVDELISTGQITGTTHLGIGQEASMVGSEYAIKPTDYIATTHRGHGHTLVKGADVKLMMAELFGREDGFCKGRAGSLHMVDMSTRNLGSNGIVGGGVGISVGAALSIQMQGEDDVVLCSFGDGATNEGGFHEGVNLASVWQLPVVFFCENNQYGMSTSIAEAFNITDLSVRAQAYGIPGYRIDGNDVIGVYETVLKAVADARSGKGPSLIVAETYRWKGHSKSDPRNYRTKEEEKEWMDKCPIESFAKIIIDKKYSDAEHLEAIEEKVYEIIEEAAEFAKNSPWPSVDTLADYVFIEEV